MTLPEFNPAGDLPDGVYEATLAEVLTRFAIGTQQRINLGNKLGAVYNVARETGFLGRFIVFGSFVTSNPLPRDVDVFIVMERGFDVTGASVESRTLLLDHPAAQQRFDASVFWMSRDSPWGGEDYWIQTWCIKRDGGSRGIIDVVSE